MTRIHILYDHPAPQTLSLAVAPRLAAHARGDVPTEGPHAARLDLFSPRGSPLAQGAYADLSLVFEAAERRLERTMEFPAADFPLARGYLAQFTFAVAAGEEEEPEPPRVVRVLFDVARVLLHPLVGHTDLWTHAPRLAEHAYAAAPETAARFVASAWEELLERLDSTGPHPSGRLVTSAALRPAHLALSVAHAAAAMGDQACAETHRRRFEARLRAALAHARPDTDDDGAPGPGASLASLELVR